MKNGKWKMDIPDYISAANHSRPQIPPQKLVDLSAGVAR